MEKHRDDGQIHSRPSPSSEKTCVAGKIYISSFNKYICVETAATASGGGEELADALRNLDLKRKSENPNLENENEKLQLKSVTIFC